MPFYRAIRPLLLASTLAGCLLCGCHGDSQQGGTPDRGQASAPRGATITNSQQQQQPNSSIPTADQIGPASPQAILHGDPTTPPPSNTPPPTQSRQPAAPPPHR